MPDSSLSNKHPILSGSKAAMIVQLVLLFMLGADKKKLLLIGKLAKP
jgi:hypothetical protein